MTLELTPIPGLSLEYLHVGTLATSPALGVIELARPQKLNAFEEHMWAGLPKAVRALEALEQVRVVLLCAQGNHFCAGIDLQYLETAVCGALLKHADPGARRDAARAQILGMQDAITSLERCKWPIVAAIHGLCIGGGVDLVAACDVRVCSANASFSVKEVDLGITADLGTLQRLPRLIGHGAAADLALTCRSVGADEALRMGLVTQVLGAGRDQLLAGALKLAAQLAAKPPQALLGTKRVMLHTRDYAGSVGVGLEYVATYNAGLLEDLATAASKRAAGSSAARPKL